MKLEGYRGPYENGFPTRYVMDDGSVWHEATPREISEAGPDAEVMFSLGGEVRRASDYAGRVMAGGHPFLSGIAGLMPVYMRDS